MISGYALHPSCFVPVVRSMAKHRRDYTILVYAPQRDFVEGKLTVSESHVNLL